MRLKVDLGFGHTALTEQVTKYFNSKAFGGSELNIELVNIFIFMGIIFFFLKQFLD